jgi:hypothetical protein
LTVYYSQTNHQIENINQELKQLVCIFTSYKQDDWDKLLPAAEFTYNNYVHSLMQQVLFMTDTSCLPRMGFEPNRMCSANESINEFCSQIAARVSEAKAKDKFKLYYDC